MNKSVYEPKLISTVTNAFNAFDQDCSEKIEVREVGNVIRSLGIYPTEVEIRQFIIQMQKDNASLYIQKPVFVEFMCDLITKDYIHGPTPQELEQALRVLSNKNDELDENTIRMQLASMGEKFSAEEIEAFISFAKDSESGKIEIKAYVKAAMDIMWKNQ